MITYRVAMPEPHTHLYHVSLVVDAADEPSLDFMLPAWAPGSYMIRDYARHVQQFQAHAGAAALRWRKLDKHTWRVETNGQTPIQLDYKVYANEISVRTSHLDASHGYFNPATLAMYLPQRSAEPLEIGVVAPDGWRVATGLELLDQASNPAGHLWRFRAADFDELVDSPFECGTHTSLHFSVDGIPHEIAIWGHGNYDAERLVADTQKIVEISRDLFGSLPYQRYLFILHLVDKGYGGLEHRNSVSNLLTRWTFQPEKSYERYLGLTSHEFFHVWNVKRLRPAPLGPFDYQRENYTRQLWGMEGVTSYYDDLLLTRAGIYTPARYLEIVADNIEQLQRQPGRQLQSLEESSFDTWIKLYRPDENSANSSISYYLKGALVSLLMDMEIRRRTDDDYCFDDLLRLLLNDYPPEGPGIPEERGYQTALEELTDSDWSQFFASYIAGTAELDYAAGLAVAGLELVWSHKDPGPAERAPAWLGLQTKTDQGRLLVSAARSDGPAFAAGIYANDELLALDGWRVDNESLTARLRERRPGDSVTLSLFRRDELLQIAVTLAAAPPDKLQIRQLAEPGPLQRKVYERWLNSNWESQ